MLTGHRSSPVDSVKRLAQICLHADDCIRHPLRHRVATDGRTAGLQAGRQLPKRWQDNDGQQPVADKPQHQLVDRGLCDRRWQSVSRSWLVGSAATPVFSDLRCPRSRESPRRQLAVQRQRSRRLTLKTYSQMTSQFKTCNINKTNIPQIRKSANNYICLTQ